MNTMRTEERNVWSLYIGDAGLALQEIETSLLALEVSESAMQEIHQIYRGLHTIKGNSALLELKQVELLAHAAEDVVGYVRDRSVPMERATLELMLGVVDVLRGCVSHISTTHRDVDGAVTEPKLVAVRAWLQARGITAPVQRVDSDADGGVHMFSDPPAPAPESGDAAGQPEPATERSLPTPELIPPPEAVARGPVANTTARNDFIRVDARKVSQVMDLAGEIGLACSAVTHHPEVEGKDLEGFSAAAHKLEMLVRELQTEISAMRLIPIATVFRSMKRVVRDTARRTGKEVDLIVTGEDTEIDKVTVEALHDPLVHLLRNAIDHGLESPQERVAAGKRATGRVLLDASHEGGEVLIRVSDDGRGIQRERVLARAFALGLADPAVKLSDNEIVSLIFRPGFSTKMQIDELSGRGVGMDVIKTSIERLRGRVRMHSEAGKGSSVSLTVPLTLAFLDAMVVRDGEHLYAIPIEKVQEVFTTREGQLCPSSAEGRTGLRVRDEVVPVLRLADYYAQRPLSATLPVGTVVVVVQSLRGPLAIGVDALHGNQPVMLKPLAGLVSQVRAAVGCAMLRSGDVALTLDCDQLDV